MSECLVGGPSYPLRSSAVKPLKDILCSPRFMREVSVLLFVFAGFSGLVGILLLPRASSDPEVLVEVIASFVGSFVNFILGLMIRRGSVKTLWIAGILFALDTLVQLAQPSGKGLGAAVISRGILIYVIIRFVRRERMSDKHAIKE
jgi:hypothetical protein